VGYIHLEEVKFRKPWLGETTSRETIVQAHPFLLKYLNRMQGSFAGVQKLKIYVFRRCCTASNHWSGRDHAGP
jgi:hypothetical protein